MQLPIMLFVIRDNFRLDTLFQRNLCCFGFQ